MGLKVDAEKLRWEEPLAIRLANRLSRDGSEHALRRAGAARDAAHLAGNIIRADLFAAVCSVIVWRDRAAAAPTAPPEAGERC